MEWFENIWDKLMINDPITTVLTLVMWITFIAFVNKVMMAIIRKRNVKLNAFQLRTKKTIYIFLFLCVILFQFKASKDIVTALLASTGILAVIIGLACQELASDLIAGMFIIVNKPFSVGELIYIQSENIKGTVMDISIRQTVIKTLTNTLLIVPNRTMNTSIIENLSRTESFALTPLLFSIAYNDDIDLACSIIKQQILDHPLHLVDREKDTRVVVSNWLDSGIELKAFIYTATSGDGIEISYDLRRSVKLAFDQQGITIPYPTITLSK